MRFPKSYAVYDTETTGLDTGTARIVELAVKVVHVGKEPVAKSWLILQDAPLPDVTRQITGITDDEVAANGVPLLQALGEFFALVGRAALVGHNIARYDNLVMEKEICRMAQAAAVTPEDRVETSAILMARLSRFVDTAALFKARAIGEEQDFDETHMEFAGRVLDVRAAGVKYNLAHACDTLGVDRAGIAAHRASGDVEMTDRLYRALALGERPGSAV